MKPGPFKHTAAETWLAGALIVLAAALTYGLLIPRLGFYRDDWYMLWAGQSQGGLTSLIRLFQTDRPLIGLTYAVIFKLFGPRVLLWQMLGLVLKILTGLSVLWLLRLVWPHKRLETTTAALLFVLYPGFYQQPVAGTFCIDLLGLNAIFISIALTVYAVKSSNRVLQVLATLAAMLLGLINLGLYEATIGLEVVRWALVWVVLRQRNTADKPAAPEPGKSAGRFSLLRPLAFYLIPYFVMLAGFLYWRLFIFTSVRRATNIDLILADYAGNPLYSLVQIAINYLKDLFETVVLAWFVPFYQFTAEGRFNIFISALLVAVLVAGLAGVYLYLTRLSPDRETPQVQDSARDERDFLLVGLIAVLIPSAVIVLLGRNVLFAIQWDRYTTQSMLGVGVLVSALVFNYLRGHARWVILSVLILLAVMTQYHSAAAYSRFWDYERNIVWQLSWRAPGIQRGTTLVVSLPEGTRLAEEYEIWGPVNMAYFPGQPMQVSGQVPTDDMILNLQSKTTETRQMRNLDIVRDYGKPLIISLPSGTSCVHVLDGKHLALPFFENGQIKEIASYSNIGLIDLTAKPASPSPAIFSQEPAHAWCYYFQKIQLALQAGNYSLAASLADEAAQKDLKPIDDTEWVPVVEAYAGIQDSRKVATTLKKMDRDVRKYICAQQPLNSDPAGQNAFVSLACGGN